MKEPNAMSPRCRLCSNDLEPDLRRVLDPQSFEIFEIRSCRTCGLKQTFPQPTDLNRYYGAVYHGGRHGLTASYCVRRRLRLLRQASGSNFRHRRLLDVGCGDGSFLLGAKKEGWDVFGTEMNAVIARAKGLDVRDSLNDFAGEELFDCLTLWHSFEHMPNPAQTLNQLVSLLSPSGVLIVAVPDAGGLQAQLFGPKWFHYDVPRHLFHFTRNSLSRLLETSGLCVERYWHQEFEYDLFGWSQSALNVLLPRPNIFFNSLTNKPTGANQFQRTTSFLLGLVFSALAVPAVLTGSLLGRGGTLIAVARHENDS